MHALTAFFLHLVDQAGYAGLFVAMTLANTGAPIGSEIVLPTAGALVATGHLSNLLLTIAIAIVAELTGQSIAYAIGRFGGRPFVDRYGKYIRFHHAELERVDRFFERYGRFAIFVCRFIPVVRGIVGIPAGIAEMPLGPFYLWTFLGSAIFCGGLILAGDALGKHAQIAVDSMHRFGAIAIALAIVALVIVLVLARRRARVASAPNAAD